MILEIDNVSHAYQGARKQRWVLKKASHTFAAGTFTSILGPSGSGKTTLLSLASGLDLPTEGTIRYRGTDLRTLGLGAYRRKHAATIFQSYNLLTYMTAAQNIRTAMEITGHRSSRRRAVELLERVGITADDAHRNVMQLSGGQQQRVAIARALACEVDLLFADEPTGNLDADTAQGIIDIFRELAHEQGTCVIVVTHSTHLARQSDQALTLAKGRITVGAGNG
ncbi:putative ABC transport system ATP-binding protein [Allocatelliglobosispora scoriae]|uniref:Putative ABC transport system ATP-binding protein n=1 Tax=Allocatelliglobosispora scoriae TaxID=643052 RepID=A0A841BT15_9ACTN|nr:ABC transporter ATP-binding protein [Allocatelliglobosispora scoriae]MBB5870319.1 putative ABC transport system ATP-binding protein [Allocatelliglobosispora scoriae]